MADTEEHEILKLLAEGLAAPPRDDDPALLTPDERRARTALTLYEYERASVQQAVAMSYVCQLAGLTDAETEAVADRAEEDAYKALGFEDEDDALDSTAPPL